MYDLLECVDVGSERLFDLLMVEIVIWGEEFWVINLLLMMLNEVRGEYFFVVGIINFSLIIEDFY